MATSRGVLAALAGAAVLGTAFGAILDFSDPARRVATAAGTFPNAAPAEIVHIVIAAGKAGPFAALVLGLVLHQLADRAEGNPPAEGNFVAGFAWVAAIATAASILVPPAALLLPLALAALVGSRFVGLSKAGLSLGMLLAFAAYAVVASLQLRAGIFGLQNPELANEIRTRMATPPVGYLDAMRQFDPVRWVVQQAVGTAQLLAFVLAGMWMHRYRFLEWACGRTWTGVWAALAAASVGLMVAFPDPVDGFGASVVRTVLAPLQAIATLVVLGALFARWLHHGSVRTLARVGRCGLGAYLLQAIATLVAAEALAPRLGADVAVASLVGLLLVPFQWAVAFAWAEACTRRGGDPTMRPVRLAAKGFQRSILCRTERA